ILRESCLSGEDRGDIHIDTEVLNEIAPLAQDRRARKSHHLTIVAGIVDKRLNNLDITFIPRLHKIVAQALNRSPEIGNSAYYGITANDCLGISETKVHILRVERCKLLHIHGIDHCIVVFYPVRHRILLLWYVSTRYHFDHIKMASQPCRRHRRRACCLSYRRQGHWHKTAQLERYHPVALRVRAAISPRNHPAHRPSRNYPASYAFRLPLACNRVLVPLPAREYCAAPTQKRD